MKVRCMNIYNDYSKEYVTTDSWLTIGKEYVVLEIYPDEKIFYRLVGDNGDKMPALYNASQFVVVSGQLPKNWAVSQRDNGALIISPSAWKHLTFWDDCYDHDPKALEIYKRELRIIYEEESIGNKGFDQ